MIFNGHLQYIIDTNQERYDLREKQMNGNEKKLHIRYFRVAAAIAVLAVLITSAVLIIRSRGKDIEKSAEDNKPGIDSDVSLIYEEPSSNDGSAPDKPNPEPEQENDNVGDLQLLKSMVEEKFSGYSGKWSAYIKNLNTGEHFTVNNSIVYPASMIKLFAMGACYQQIEEGKINEDYYYTYIYSMVVMSNNTAFNQMIWAIGRDYLTKWCHENGYNHTYQYHGLLPSDNAGGLTTANRDNETCASDVGHMLEDIYNGKCVSKEASEKMLDLLKKQHWRNKIPSGIPYGTTIANKTGDTDNQSHDAAIVYSDNADYIIVIMSEEPGVSFDNDYRFIEISKMVYEYFNPTA